jgi:16S rRNA (guanine527-N7)-methyltransferase
MPSVDRALSELVRQYGLPAGSVERLRALVEIVATDPLAPTTVRERRRIIEDHIADSLVALGVDAVRAAARIADLGAGAGFPGLPLAIALPGAQVTLVESSSRKAEFIRRAADICGAANTDVVDARVEEWRAGLDACDVVTARALAPPDVVAEYAAPLLRIGGTLVIWRGRRDPAAEAAAAHAAADLGLEVGPVIGVDPYAGAEYRHLHVFVKTARTP